MTYQFPYPGTPSNKPYVCPQCCEVGTLCYGVAVKGSPEGHYKNLLNGKLYSEVIFDTPFYCYECEYLTFDVFEAYPLVEVKGGVVHFNGEAMGVLVKPVVPKEEVFIILVLPFDKTQPVEFIGHWSDTWKAYLIEDEAYLSDGYWDLPD